MFFKKKKKLRRSNRFYPKEDAYIVFSPNFTKRGSIINIGKKGLACLYFVDKTTRENNIDKYVNIRCGAFTLTEIPFKIASDTLISDNLHRGQRIFRKRSIMFCDLDVAQEQQIDFFLKNHTRQPVSSTPKEMSKIVTQH